MARVLHAHVSTNQDTIYSCASCQDLALSPPHQELSLVPTLEVFLELGMPLRDVLTYPATWSTNLKSTGRVQKQSDSFVNFIIS